MPTTVVTLSNNTRLEDVTIILSLNVALNAGPYIALDFVSGASITAKFRTSVITATLLSGSTNLYGIRSSGVSSLLLNPAHAVRSSQISVTATGSLQARAVYVNGPNQFTMRDVILFCQGTGSDLVACETTNTNSELTIKSSTVSGATTDILRTNGKIFIGSTDLVNHTAPFSFTETINTSKIFFGLLGFPGGNSTYYLPPGITPIASVSTISPYPLLFTYMYVVISITITYSGTINVGDTITFTIYRNNVATALSVTLTSVTGPTITLSTIGETFLATDYLDARMTTVNNPDVGTFTASIIIY